MFDSNTNKQNEWKEREIGALWKRTSKSSGSTFCTGSIIVDELGNKVRKKIVMFANKGKQNDKHPDYIIYLSNDDDGPPTPVEKPQPPKRSSLQASGLEDAGPEPAKKESVGADPEDDNIPL